MFTPQKLFHFVFANQEDDYYTSSLMKLTLEGFLWRELVDQKYRSVIIREKGIVSAYTLLLTGITAGEFFNGQKSKKRKSLFRWREQEEEEIKQPQPQKEKLEIQGNGIMNVIDKILDMMNGTGRKIALVIPVDLLQRYCDSSDERKKYIKKLAQKNNQNIIVAVSTVFAEDNDPFFTDPDWMRKQTAKTTDSVFTKKDICPELYQALSPGNDKPRMIMTYDRMKSELKEQMNVFNTITVPLVQNILKYHCIRNESCCREVYVNMAAVIICLWFGNACFYDKYQYTGLMSENMGHSFRMIAEDICKSSFEAKLKEIIQKENISDPQQLLEKWSYTEEGVYFPQNKAYISESPIVKIMRKYQTLLVRHNAADETRLKEMAKVISFFQKPYYVSKEITGIPSFLNFEDSAEQKKIKDIIRYLENKAEWNEWDKEIARLLYILFHFCKAEAEEECSRDYQCRMGQIRYKKLTEAMHCFRSFSRKSPGQLGELKRLKDDISYVLGKNDFFLWEKLVFPVC